MLHSQSQSPHENDCDFTTWWEKEVSLIACLLGWVEFVVSKIIYHRGYHMLYASSIARALKTTNNLI
jgi:hypothetical protein